MMRIAGAAVALVAGTPNTTTALDYSRTATDMCGGQPQVVGFQGPFPRGTHVCLNCSAAIGPSPAPHANPAAACIAHCLDLFATDDTNVPPSAAATEFCTAARARLSTNFQATVTATTGCYDTVCDAEGGLSPTFPDPRRVPEPVDWVSLDGVSNSVGTLTRTAPTTGVADAGASSNQSIEGGDGYLQFTATETTTARAAGLSFGPAPPGGIAFTDIGFGILLLSGEIHVIVNGNSVGTFGAYSPGDRFRVKLRDNFNARQATVSFARLTGTSEMAIQPAETYTISYPVRADAMIREQGGAVTEAKLVFIHPLR
jgi:hypothetical protein